MTFSKSSSVISSEDVDAQVMAFIDQKIKSLVQWDLLHFFHKTPYMADTAENIASYTARDVGTVERELEELVKNGVLRSKKTSSDKIFALTTDTDMLSLIDDFATACDNRKFRMYAIRHITSKRRR